MSQIKRYVQARPWVGWLFFFCVLASGAGLVAEQQMKLTDGTFANKVVVYTLDGQPASASGGDASEEEQETQTTELQAVRAATEATATSTEAINLKIKADAVEFSTAQTSGPQLFGMFDDTSPTATTEGHAAQLRMSANRNLYGTLRDAAGNERGANVTAGNELSVELGAGTAYAGKVRATDGTYDASLDPCQTETKTTTPFSQTTIANIISADAAKTNYICAISIVASAAEAVSVVEDDTSGCGSITAALAGSTTAANGMSFAANGGFALGNGAAAVLKGSAANRYLCISQDGSDRISGFVTWVQR
jgi:hypothetical protein